MTGSKAHGQGRWQRELAKLQATPGTPRFVLRTTNKRAADPLSQYGALVTAKRTTPQPDGTVYYELWATWPEHLPVPQREKPTIPVAPPPKQRATPDPRLAQERRDLYAEQNALITEHTLLIEQLAEVNRLLGENRVALQNNATQSKGD
mgnify:CR=1 FL=1